MEVGMYITNTNYILVVDGNLYYTHQTTISKHIAVPKR